MMYLQPPLGRGAYEDYRGVLDKGTVERARAVRAGTAEPWDATKRPLPLFALHAHGRPFAHAFRTPWDLVMVCATTHDPRKGHVLVLPFAGHAPADAFETRVNVRKVRTTELAGLSEAQAAAVLGRWAASVPDGPADGGALGDYAAFTAQAARCMGRYWRAEPAFSARHLRAVYCLDQRRRRAAQRAAQREALAEIRMSPHAARAFPAISFGRDGFGIYHGHRAAAPRWILEFNAVYRARLERAGIAVPRMSKRVRSLTVRHP